MSGIGVPNYFVLGAGGFLGLLLAALLLRSACDLCLVEPPPGYPRCLLITLLLVLIAVPLGIGASFMAAMIAAAVRISSSNAPLVAMLLALPASAVICTLVFLAAFRVGPLKAAAIWLVNTLLNGLVATVLLLLLMGGWVTVEAVRRLF
jgi:hypothetical protein